MLRDAAVNISIRRTVRECDGIALCLARTVCVSAVDCAAHATIVDVDDVLCRVAVFGITALKRTGQYAVFHDRMVLRCVAAVRIGDSACHVAKGRSRPRKRNLIAYAVVSCVLSRFRRAAAARPATVSIIKRLVVAHGDFVACCRVADGGATAPCIGSLEVRSRRTLELVGAIVNCFVI